MAVRWGSYGNPSVKNLTNDHAAETSVSRRLIKDFWKLSRLVASIAVLLGFMCTLVVVTVAFFLSEAFLAILYKGPGTQLAVGANFLVSTRKFDIITVAYHPNDNLLRDCTNSAGHLSVHCNPQHTIRTTRLSFKLHILVDYQTMGTVDDRLVLRYCSLRIHLYAIRPGSPRVASPSTRLI